MSIPLSHPAKQLTVEISAFSAFVTKRVKYFSIYIRLKQGLQSIVNQSFKFLILKSSVATNLPRKYKADNCLSKISIRKQGSRAAYGGQDDVSMNDVIPTKATT